MELTALLAASGASEEFRADVLSYAHGGTATRLQLARRSPPIKVMRVLKQLLFAEPGLAIESVSIDARSGCSDYIGSVTVHTGGTSHHFAFAWDCHWRAVEQEWTDDFGFPDQIRAAREFDWRCFREWRHQGVTTRPGANRVLAS